MTGTALDVGDTVLVGPLTLHLPVRKVYFRNERIKLTTAQWDTLELLVRARGAMVSRDAISRAALGLGWDGIARSVDQVVCVLRRKLPPDAEGNSMIVGVRGRGYLIPVAPPC